MTKVHDSVLSVPDTGKSDIKVLLMMMSLRVALLRQVRAPLSFVGPPTSDLSPIPLRQPSFDASP